MRELYRNLEPQQGWIAPFMGDVNVNVGAGHSEINGFINHNGIWLGTDTLPYGASSVDLVLASHVMEHVEFIIHAMRDIHRILRPGGHFIAITPYGASDDAWEDPTHVRTFTDLSWHYFDKRLYERRGHAGSYDSLVDYSFDVVQLNLVPYPEFANDPEIEFKKRHWRNVIREMHAVLKAVK